MIGSTKNNRVNYPRKCFWTQDIETRVKRYSAFKQLGSEVELAWQNSRHFETPPLVSTRSDVWETSAEIPYWWRNTMARGTGWCVGLVKNLLQPIRSTDDTEVVMKSKTWWFLQSLQSKLISWLTWICSKQKSWTKKNNSEVHFWRVHWGFLFQFRELFLEWA